MIENLEYIATGKSAIVYGISNERVIKDNHDPSSKDVEQRVYERTRGHRNIAEFFGIQPDGCIIIERGQVLRQYQQNRTISLDQKLEWLIQAAYALMYMHKNNIILADVGCHNMIITKDGRLKLIDFEGCSVDGGPASSAYEWFSYRKSTPKISEQTDIFAFGCAMFEVITGQPPHNEYLSRPNRTTVVEELYAHDQFPDVQHLPLGQLISDCWYANFKCMGDVGRALRLKQMMSHKTTILPKFLSRIAAIFRF